MNRWLTLLGVLIAVCAAGACFAQDAGLNYEHLKFFEPYIGTWSIHTTLPEDMPFGKKGETGAATLTWKWDYGKNVVDWQWVFDFPGKHSGTKGTVTWDPIQNTLVGAGVSSDGGIIRVTGRSTDPLTLNVEGVAADGKKSSQVETFTLVDAKTLTIRTTERKGWPAPGDSPVYTFNRVRPSQAVSR